MTAEARSAPLSVDPRFIACHSPRDRSLLGEVPISTQEDVRATLDRARRVQRALAEAPLRERARLLRHVLRRVLEQQDAIVELVVQDSGKTRENALLGEIWTVCEKLRWTIARGPKHLRPEPVSSGLLAYKRARLEYRPLGVVGAIIPWNYPFQNLMNPLISALMVGNAYVAKPSEWVAWSSAELVRRVRGWISEAGFPDDLVQVVQGFGDTGRALIEEKVDVLVFIGSPGNGRRVLEAAAKNLTPVVLELGGKDPLVVCADAYLEQAVHASIGGCFINAGQNCVSSERILVEAPIAKAFEERVAAIVSRFRQGPEEAMPDMGAMITPLQLDHVERLVRRAVEQGARLVTGGRRVFAAQGDYFAPTILADVTPEMEVMHTEAFGPIMLLCPFRTEEEAVQIANGTPYGLSASVFSKDLARARRIAARVESGMVAINEFGGVTYMVQDLTFGGVKESGYGRMNGRDGLRALCNVRAVLDDRFPFFPVQRLFPVRPRDYGFAQGVIRLRYGAGWREKLRGLLGLLRAGGS
jgi:acyl-CoA reductase-like NAD-dependent aldehyde dehydrogenase